MRKINLAILGQGRSGYLIHGQHLLRDTDRFRVAAVIDALPERREKAERVFGCRTYADWSAVLNDPEIELCVNALYSSDHHPATVALLKAGKHVLVEKPAARTPEQLDEMEQAARDAGQALAIFQQTRFASYYRKIKEVLASGALGRIVQVSIAFDGYARRWDWQTLQRNTAGSLYNTGPHPLDLALDLLGGKDMPSVLCRMDRALTFGDAEDYAKLILTLPGRPLIDVSVSCCNAYPSGIFNIQGTRGGLWCNAETVKWRWFVEDEAPKQQLIEVSLTTPDGEPAYCVEDLPWHEAEWNIPQGVGSFMDAVSHFYTNLYEHLTEGKPLLVKASEVRRQLAVVLECHRQNPLSRMDG